MLGWMIGRVPMMRVLQLSILEWAFTLWRWRGSMSNGQRQSNIVEELTGTSPHLSPFAPKPP